MEIGAVPTLSRKKKSAASVDSHLFLPGFIGYMRKFLLDNIEVLPLITPVGTPKRIVSENSAYTFKSSSGYVAVSSNQDDEKLDIQFVFRTAEANGLILFNGQPGKDFIALELLHGNLQYISDMGNGAQIISSSTLKPLNDNLWHNVHVAETSRSHHMFIVDGRKFLAEGPKKKFSLDLDGPLFIGGVPMKTLLVLPRMVRSQTGFMGCLAEIKIGGRVVDLVTEGQDIEGVARGCEEPKSECHSSLCKHGGKCVRQWSGFGCDCDMTSFSGSNCSKCKCVTSAKLDYLHQSHISLIIARTLFVPKYGNFGWFWSHKSKSVANSLFYSQNVGVARYLGSDVIREVRIG